MWFRRAVAIVVIGTLLGSAYAYADNQGLFKGFQKVKVLVNGKELSNLTVPGFVVDGKTVLPLRDVADATGAAVLFDSDKQVVNIVKPNAHLLVADSITKDFAVRKVFGKIAKGKKEDFSVFAQVDSLKVDVTKVKLSIEDPAGITVDSYEQKLKDVGSDFWFLRPFNIRFSQSGTYTVNLYIEIADSKEYVLISSKTILSE